MTRTDPDKAVRLIASTVRHVTESIPRYRETGRDTAELEAFLRKYAPLPDEPEWFDLPQKVLSDQA